MSIARLKIADDDFSTLRAHLLRPDKDEHAAILLCGHVSTQRTETLLVRELHLVSDEDFAPSDRGYRKIVPRLIAELSGRAADLGLSFVPIHSHPLADRHNGLSDDDLASHERLFPHLLDIVGDHPIAGIALGHRSVAGEVWLSKDKRLPLDALEVVGHNRIELTPEPREQAAHSVPERFDRQVLLFGEAGQRILKRLRVGVIGLGGGGSMITEQLAHLGVGEVILVDFDSITEVNLNRIVGSRPSDAAAGMKKIEVVRRHIDEIDDTIRTTAIDGDLSEAPVARLLRDLDFLFLATDTITSRLVFNGLVYRFLIPGIQIGAKVEQTGDSEPEVYVAVRPVYPTSGCLQCNGLISPGRLQEEARSPEERVAQNYLNTPEVTDPSVISLNGTGASMAVTTMLFWATGLAQPQLRAHRLIFSRSGEMNTISDRRDDDCPFCGRGLRSHFAGGDPVEALPVRRGRVA